MSLRVQTDASSSLGPSTSMGSVQEGSSSESRVAGVSMPILDCAMARFFVQDFEEGNALLQEELIEGAARGADNAFVAEGVFGQGMQHYISGNYIDAAEFFKAAGALSSDPSFLSRVQAACEQAITACGAVARDLQQK